MRLGTGRAARGLVLVAASVVIASCGTRVERAQAPAAAAVQEELGTLASPVNASAVPAPPALEAQPGPVSASAGGSSLASAARSPAASRGTVAVNSTPVPNESPARQRGPAPGAAGAPAGAAPRPSAGPVEGGSPGSGGTVVTGAKSPVVLASVGTYSGPVGTILFPYAQGAQVWVKYVNARGGLNGHPVKLAIHDDGSDPARHDAEVKQAVEHDHVLGFLVNASPFASTSTADYLRGKRIPVIGISTAEAWAYSNPMYFPQASSAEELNKTYGPPVIELMRRLGKTKIGTVHCVEAPGCANAENGLFESAKAAGLQVVYRAQTSLAQPDFTAECLAASRAGAELFYIFLDQNSTGRVAAACARQGYRPIYGLPNPGIADVMKDNPLYEGAIASATTFPWFQSNTPGTLEYQEARKTFGAGIVNGTGTTLGWTAGKLLERAGANLPEPPTTAALLEGLWTIHDDDLGGLTYPLRFTRDQPAKPLACWFALSIRGGVWVSTNGFVRGCLPEH